MKDIILTHDEIVTRKENPVNKNFKGAYGACSYYENGLIKIFYTDIKDRILKNIEANLKRSSNIIMYPKAKVLEKDINKLCGYYMDIAPGKTLLRLRNEMLCGKSDMSFEYFLYLYYDKFLPELKNEEVLISDMKSCQIYIDDNIYLTDTDTFLDKQSNDTKIWLRLMKYNNVLNGNLNEINKVFYETFNFNGRVYIWMDDYDLGNVNYMYKFIDEIKSKTNQNIKTFKEFFSIGSD